MVYLISPRDKPPMLAPEDLFVTDCDTPGAVFRKNGLLLFQLEIFQVDQCAALIYLKDLKLASGLSLPA